MVGIIDQTILKVENSAEQYQTIQSDQTEVNAMEIRGQKRGIIANLENLR